MLPNCFVTGTDTDAGKTVVTAAILRAWTRQGLSCAGVKPVASGFDWVDGELRNNDIESIKAASSYALPQPLLNQYSFEPAIAPHIAASEAGIVISDSLIHDRITQAADLVDRIVVEGAGGWRVPLSMAGVSETTGAGEEFGSTASGSIASLAKALNLPVVLVVGMKLGCINHALLSAEAIIADGVPLLGWVANNSSPIFDRKAENLDTLKAMMPASLLFEVPFFVDQRMAQAFIPSTPAI